MECLLSGFGYTRRLQLSDVTSVPSYTSINSVTSDTIIIICAGQTLTEEWGPIFLLLHNSFKLEIISLFNEILEVFGSISHDFCINDILSCHNARVQFTKLSENVRTNRITFVFLHIRKKVWFIQIQI